jgi:hypothetical protein
VYVFPLGWFIGEWGKNNVCICELLCSPARARATSSAQRHGRRLHKYHGLSAAEFAYITLLALLLSVTPNRILYSLRVLRLEVHHLSSLFLTNLSFGFFQCCSLCIFILFCTRPIRSPFDILVSKRLRLNLRPITPFASSPTPHCIFSFPRPRVIFLTAFFYPFRIQVITFVRIALSSLLSETSGIISVPVRLIHTSYL